jgi:hypothetical protein
MIGLIGLESAACRHHGVLKKRGLIRTLPAAAESPRTFLSTLGTGSLILFTNLASFCQKFGGTTCK